MERIENKFHRPILYQIDNRSLGGTPTAESEVLRSDSIANFYSTTIFNTPDSENKLAHILPLLNAIDAHPGSLIHKRITLSYLFWASESDIDKNAEILGIERSELSQHVNIMLAPSANPDQIPSQKIYEMITNQDSNSELILNLMRSNWRNGKIADLLNIEPAYISSMRKKLKIFEEQQSS